MVAKGSRAWPARSVFVSNFTRLPVRVPLPSLSPRRGGRAGSIFAARRPVQRDKSLINAVDRLDVIKFPLVRGFRLRKRSPTAGETSFEGDPILLSSRFLCFAKRPILTDGYFRGGRRIVPDPIDLRIPVFLVRLFSLEKRIRRNSLESRTGEDRMRRKRKFLAMIRFTMTG